MKRLFGNLASVLSCLLVLLTLAQAAQLKEARVTQIVKDVKLLPQQAAPRPAAEGDPVRAGTAVRTGTESRSELTFADLTITRLGANTIFSFDEGTRTMNLRDGAILFQVPKGTGGATIKTAAVTAAITGTTGIGEYHPATATNPKPMSKWLCLEGIFRLYLPNGLSAELGPGKTVSTDGETFSKILIVDIGQVMRTALLVIGYKTDLASKGAIQIEERKQLDLKIAGGFVDTNLVAFLDPTSQQAFFEQLVTALESNPAVASLSPSVSPSPSISPSPTVSPTATPSVTPAPTPSKTGTPSVIVSSDPYIIDSDTVIQTDPSITRNGVTDFGKIWRGPSDDGAFSAYLFGSTSAFDIASGFDDYFAAKAPIAAFKFQSLQLIGNPTIMIPAGGATNLALVGIDGITSGAPGGTLTFSGLDSLLLATQNGSINLRADLTFDGLALYVYARGANSTLTFDSLVSGTTDLYLHSEGDLQISDALAVMQENDGKTTGLNISLRAGGSIDVGGDLSLTTDASDVANGGNIWVISGGDMTIGGAFTLFIGAAADSTTETGGNITVSSSGSLTAGSLNFDLFFDDSDGVTNGENVSVNVAGNLTTTSPGGVTLRLSTPVDSPLTNGGNLSMMVGGNLNIGAGQSLNMTLINTVSTMVSDGANLSASIGGDLSAAAINATIDNSQNGGIGTGGNLTLDIGGSANSGAFTVLIDNSSGGQIGAGGNISASVDENVDTGDFSATIDNSSNGSIGTGGNISLSIGGDLTATGGMDFTIQNTAGTINDGGNITLVVDGGISTAGAFSLLVENYNQTANPAGHIGTGGGISLTTGGNLTADSMSVAINNRGGGVIDSGASLVLNIGGALTTLHDGLNFIGGTASLSLAISSRYDDQAGNTAGSFIGGDATLLFHSDSASIGGILSVAVSDRGGTIDGDALLNFSVTHDMTVQGADDVNFQGESAATWQILNDNGPPGGVASPFGGTIHGNANLLVSATNLNLTAGSLEVSILNRNGGVSGPGGTIDSDANITFTLSGNLTTQGSAFFGILNQLQPGGTNGGTIGGDATINVTAADISTGLNSFGDSLASSINNATGNIGGSAIVNVDVTDVITAQGPAVFTIDNNDGGTIAGDATLLLTAGNILTDQGTFFPQIFNHDGGMIGGDAAVTINAADITVNGNDGGGASFNSIIFNQGGKISGAARIHIAASGDVFAQQVSSFQILSDDIGSGVGSVGTDATILVEAANYSTGADLAAIIGNQGASIGGSASANFDISGAVASQTWALYMFNNEGTIGSDGALNFSIGSASVGADFAASILNQGGEVGRNASITLAASANFSAGNIFDVSIVNEGGTIGGNATIDVSAVNVSSSTLFTEIQNTAGNIGGNAILDFGFSGDINTQGNAEFGINNSNGSGPNGGTIGLDATINVTAQNVTADAVFASIINFGGNIGGNAVINVGMSGDVNTPSGASFQIINDQNDDGDGPGAIGSDAIIGVSAGNLTAGSLLAQIDNKDGGMIGGDATINMDVSTRADISGDATLEILGSDGASGAAININGGTYAVGGTFLAFIDGNGSIGLTNAFVAADVLKVGVFGANGLLNIGGGSSLSADTTLKLYAPGSSGEINFISDVTLSSGSGTIIAGQRITIQPTRVVTIAGTGGAAQIFTNDPNYNFTPQEGYAGPPPNPDNGSFGGLGANDPQPLSDAPAFDDPPPPPVPSRTARANVSRRIPTGTNVTSSRRIEGDLKPANRKTTGTVIKVRDSGQLLSLLDRTVPGPGGQITLPASNRMSNSRNPDRTNAARRLSADRIAVNRESAPSSHASRLP